MPSARELASAILGIVLSAGTVTGSAPPAVRIDVLARDVAPGEAVRIRASFDRPVASVEGSFLARALSFAPEEPAGGALEATVWSAWSLVTLDETARRALIDVAGRSREGVEVRGSRTVSIRAKSFPTQRLTVESQYVTPPKETQERIERERADLAAVYALRTRVPFPSSSFVRPVRGAPTSAFGARRIFNGEPRDPHPGLDLKAAPGTPVHAAGPGWVRLARDLYFAGGTVILDHGAGLFTVYAHLSKWEVSEGEQVEPGQVLGASGATGRVTGPHLHWGAKIGDLPVDPRSLLDATLFPGPAKAGASAQD